MDFQILISTVNGAFIKRNNTLNSQHIIINQVLDDTLDLHNTENMLSYREKGLSRSRNRAITNAKADICLISDDDVAYKDDIESTILSAFKNNPDVDIITFQVETPEGDSFKSYKNKQFNHTLKTIMKVSSVEIAFRRSSLIQNNISFDEEFGLGSTYPTGEEAIFLSDALKKGLKLLYVPKVIVVHPIESSGGNYKNPILAQAKGAMIYRIFGVIGYLIITFFAIKHHRKTPYTLFGFMKEMYSGAKIIRTKK